MIPWYWQVLKGILVLTVLIIVISLVAWFIQEFEKAVIITGIVMVIIILIIAVMVIWENLRKLFESFWGGPPAAST